MIHFMNVVIGDFWVSNLEYAIIRGIAKHRMKEAVKLRVLFKSKFGLGIQVR